MVEVIKVKTYLRLVFCIILCLSFAACTNSKNTSVSDTSNIDYSDRTNPVADIVMENGDVIKLELYPKAAPNTVNNFIYLANKGFYNGLTFHRLVPNFIIQGGDPEGTGIGGPGYKIKGEFSTNGVDNKLKHTKGVISMARSQGNDTAGSQFFIMVSEATNLDGQYAAFGKVIEGMSVVDKIVASERDSEDKPLKAIVIKKITVDLKGKTYSEPEKIQ